MRHLLRMLATVALLTVNSSSQTIIHDILGPSANFATKVGGLGDVDGDGIKDFGVFETIPVVVPGGASFSGRVYAYSGASGALLRIFNPLPGELTHGWFFGPIGDLNGDGLEDIYIISSQIVRFYSVVSGSVLMSWPGPWGTFVSIGDVNGDMVSDLATMACDPGVQPPCPTVGYGLQVYSGATGAHLYTRPDPMPGRRFGWSMDRVADVNGDGVDEVVVGDPGSIGFPCCPGAAYLISGIDGSILHWHNGTAIWDSFGWDVAGLDDVDGDGVPDYGVWVPGYPGFFQGWNPQGGIGRTLVYSGATGNVVLTIDCPAGACFNPTDSLGKIENLGDLDGDGAADLLRTAVSASVPPGEIVAYSGRTGGMLFGNTPTLAGLALLSPAAPVGDLDGDGTVDVVVWGYDFSSALGHAIVMSLAPANTSVFGSGCPAGGPRIGRSGRTIPGSTLTVNLSGVAPGQPAWLAIGASNTSWAGIPLPLDLGIIGLPGCAVLVSPDELCSTTSLPVGPQSARASLSFAIPPQLTQITLYGQWLVQAAPGSAFPWQFSPGLRADF